MPSNVFVSDKQEKGIVTTLSVVVPHTAYWLSIRPQDICYTKSGIPFTVEKVKLSGGSGKVTQCEIAMRLTDLQGNQVTNNPKDVEFQNFFKVRL